MKMELSTHFDEKVGTESDPFYVLINVINLVFHSGLESQVTQIAWIISQFLVKIFQSASWSCRANGLCRRKYHSNGIAEIS